MKILKPNNDFHAGTESMLFIDNLEADIKSHKEVILDLSDVIFMDTFTYRVVFNSLPRLFRVIPPKSPHVIEMYNTWLDSKKDLCKNFK